MSIEDTYHPPPMHTPDKYHPSKRVNEEVAPNDGELNPTTANAGTTRWGGDEVNRVGMRRTAEDGVNAASIPVPSLIYKYN